jgi:hypothetical protein
MYMYLNSRITFAGALCLLLGVGASACGRKDQDTATTRDTAAGAVEASTPVQVADLTLGKGIGADKRVTNQTDTFGTRDTIYASVRTTGGSATSAQQLTARWTFQDGQVVDERTETISPTGEAYTEFHISKPSAWPQGKYTLRVLLNGSEVQTKDFTVR